MTERRPAGRWPGWKFVVAFFIFALPAIFWFTLILPHPPEHVTVARAFHIIAHKGASADAPENTLAAFKRAVEMGSDVIELDVHQTRDSQLVVLHDASVNRTTNGIGWVKDLSLEEIRRFDAGGWFSNEYAGERIPTLAEVFDEFKLPTTFLVELKEGSDLYPGIEARMVDLIREKRLEPRVILKSFDSRILETLRNLAPDIRRLKVVVTEIEFMHIVIGRGIQFGTILDDSVQYLEYHWIGFNRNFVTDAHERGYGVFAWDVNNVDRMKEVLESGVDGIETDHPDLLKTVLANQ